jgi:hypothetical protein
MLDFEVMFTLFFELFFSNLTLKDFNLGQGYIGPAVRDTYHNVVRKV